MGGDSTSWYCRIMEFELSNWRWKGGVDKVGGHVVWGDGIAKVSNDDKQEFIKSKQASKKYRYTPLLSSRSLVEANGLF